jgi:putative selenate reductase
MPADEAEVRAALEEGVELIELAAPARIVSRGGKLTSLECRRMQLVPAENGGRPRPVPVPGDTFPLPADSVIPAFGQETDVDFYGDDIKKLNGDYREQKGKVFIGGDAKHGASFLIRSIADGKEVAEEILRRSGAGPAQGRTNRHGTDRREHHRKLSQVLPRVETRCVEPGKRTLDRPVELPMEREEVEREASRCLDCDEICDICVTVCPNRANLAWKTVPVAHRVFTVAFEGRDYALQAEADLVIEQEYQVLNISDLCNECGNCTTFCPSAGRPFVDKPRIALTEESFRTLDRVFRIRPGEAMYKEGEKTYVLTRTSRGWDFRSGGANVSLNARFDVVAAERGPAGDNTLSLRNAVRMRIIGEALRSQYPELLK